MNKHISYFILGLAVLGGLTACNKQLFDEPQARDSHRVHFASGAAQTKTGITVTTDDEGHITMTPDWSGTKKDNIHLFEIEGGASKMGETTDFSSDDNITAFFEADFTTTEMTIIVQGDEDEDSAGEGDEPLGKSGTVSQSGYYYSAVVAKMQMVDNTPVFSVPAVQTPKATSIDPDADFLIGYSRKPYDTQTSCDEPVVDLYFDRPVAIARLNMYNFTESANDQKIKEVVIKATGLSGTVAYAAIDFKNADVNFTSDANTETLTLDYEDGIALAEDGTFCAYFVALPVTATVSEIVVTTDKSIYTRKYATEGSEGNAGKEFALSATVFKSFKLDLSKATRTDAAPAEIKWYKASMLEDGIDYLIVSGGQALKNNDGATAAVSVTDNEGVITLKAADPTIVWTATAKTYTTGDNGEGGIVAGHFTLTNNGYYLRRQSNTDILLDTTVPSDKPKYVVWDYDGSYLKHESSETATFFCFYNNGWSTGYTSNGAAPGSDIKTVQIYTSRAPQELTFTPAASAEYDLATREWTVAVPTLGGAQTDVTYALSENSNPAVATVDADGTVHPLSRGTVTIVATAAGNDQYQAASASYTLVITDSSITTPIWYKASVLEAGYGYIIVSNGHVLVKNKDGEIPFAKEVSVSSNNTIAMESSEDILWTAAAVTSDYGQCTLKNGSVYLYRSGYQDSNLKLICEETSSANYVPWRYDGNYLSNGKTTQYYAYYDGGWKMLLVSEGDTGKPIVTTQLFTLRAPQTLSFDSPAKAEYDLYSKSWTKAIPTPSGYQTTVTYALSEDSNPAVATVDADGTVHPLSKGTVTIVATAEGNAQYQAASASYELEVIDTTPVEMVTITLKKATRLSAGQKYVLVSNGKALVRDGSDAATADFNSSDLTVAVPTSLRNNLEWTLKQPGNSGNMYQFTNNEYYFGIARKTSPTPYTYWITVSTTPDNLGANTTMMNVAISLADEDIYYKGSNNSQYIYFDKASNQWDRAEISNKDSNTDYKTALYVVDDGTTPGGGDDQVTVTTYQKVSSDSDLTVGSKYIIVYEEGSKAFKPILPSSSSSTFTAGVNNVEEVSISGAMIHSEALSDSQIILEKEGDNYYLYVKSSQKYLSFSRNGLLATTDKSNTNGNYNVSISISGGIASLSRNSNGTPYYILFDSYFKNSSSSPNVSLYKLVE